MVPILGLMASQLNETSETDKSDTDKVKAASSIQDDHHPALLSLLAEELSVNPQEIHDFELCVLPFNKLATNAESASGSFSIHNLRRLEASIASSYSALGWTI